jgi:hypothetical protein
MRRLRKYLWITCVAGSVVVGALSIGLGVASYLGNWWLRYAVDDYVQPSQWIAKSGQGSVSLILTHPPDLEWARNRRKIWHGGVSRRGWDGLFHPHSTWGFTWHYYTVTNGPPGNPPISYVFIRIPYWFILLLCLPAPVIAWRRRRKRPRTEREGLCRVCGYDLRASESRCPECGTPFTASPGTRLVAGIVLSKCDRPGSDPDFR